MSKKRRNHSPEFKSKVALAAIKGDKTLSELSQQYGVNGNGTNLSLLCMKQLP